MAATYWRALASSRIICATSSERLIVSSFGTTNFTSWRPAARSRSPARLTMSRTISASASAISQLPDVGSLNRCTYRGTQPAIFRQCVTEASTCSAHSSRQRSWSVRYISRSQGLPQFQLIFPSTRISTSWADTPVAKDRIAASRTDIAALIRSFRSGLGIQFSCTQE